ncbi:MAG: hypothetical protein ACRDJE_04880 [Dehalococcoidia bacterium]
MNETAPGRMDMGDIVAGAWNIYRRAPLAWLAVTLVSVVVTFAGLWAVGDRFDLGVDPTEEEVEDALTAGSPFLGMILIADFFTHVAVVAAAVGVLRSKAVRTGEAYARAVRALLPALIASLIAGVVFVILAATILLIPLGIFFFVNWILAVQVIVDEGGGPINALRRSRQIVRGQWWRTLGISVAISLLGFLPSFLAGRITAPFDQMWLSALGSAAGAAIALPFIGIAQTLLYTDLRSRKGESPLAEPVGDVQ